MALGPILRLEVGRVRLYFASAVFAVIKGQPPSLADPIMRRRKEKPARA